MRAILLIPILFILVNVYQIGCTQEKKDVVKTIQFYPKQSPLDIPIYTLGSTQKLVLQFDVLEEDAPYLYYQIEHFSADWSHQEQIIPNDFIDGFASGSINDYEFSFNTETLYTHYEFEFPNQRLNFKISGNYKIIVYDDSPENVLFERKFYVTENHANIWAEINNSVSANNFETTQQVDVIVDIGDLANQSQRTDFITNIQQNQRQDNELTNIVASRYREGQLIYDNPFKQRFESGNEFRWFNIKSLRYKMNGVAEIEQKDNGVNVWLLPDLKRNESKFIVWNDFNGQYVIEHQEGNQPSIDSDYAHVHFSLETDPEFLDKEIYVFGALTNWQIDPKAKLHLNKRENFLTTSLFLKQGNYDYQYIMKVGDEYSVTPIEGSFYRTENKYTIYVYYSPFSANYDRLIGVKTIRSEIL